MFESIIIDTDLGSSTDDVATICMAYSYMRQGRAVLLGIVVDRMGEQNAVFADILNTYFGFPDIPIGLCRNGVENPQIFTDYAHIAEKKRPNGTPLFTRTQTMFEDDYKVYRKILASQPDKSVTVLSIGFLTSLANLLTSSPDEYSELDGVTLVAQKIKRIIIMGGKFDETDKNGEYNILQSGRFARVFFDLFPKEIPMSYSPEVVGNALYWTKTEILQTLSHVAVHPLKQIYLDCPEDPYQRMWDPLTIIQAVEGDDYFSWSPQGIVTLQKDFTLTFSACCSGNSRYQKRGTEEQQRCWMKMIENTF
ncbi:MAG: nucleoside hydrolase [Bacteroidales bacterium]|nr:nucleoside hydrolase [Bacteroidales bacterium]